MANISRGGREPQELWGNSFDQTPQRATLPNPLKRGYTGRLASLGFRRVGEAAARWFEKPGQEE